MTLMSSLLTLLSWIFELPKTLSFKRYNETKSTYEWPIVPNVFKPKHKTLMLSKEIFWPCSAADTAELTTYLNISANSKLYSKTLYCTVWNNGPGKDFLMTKSWGKKSHDTVALTYSSLGEGYILLTPRYLGVWHARIFVSKKKKLLFHLRRLWKWHPGRNRSASM
jgi:hypothetical protein